MADGKCCTNRSVRWQGMATKPTLAVQVVCPDFRNYKDFPHHILNGKH